MWREKTMAQDVNTKVISIDEGLSLVGGIGRFQLFLDLILLLMTIPVTFQVFIMYFSTMSPTWKCAQNSSYCVFNGTLQSEDVTRCSIPRGEWEYTKPKEYSLVTQFDMVCEKEWLIELLTSIFFISWALGAVVLGWVGDNYGRRVVLMPCYVTIIVTGFISSFLPSIYLIVGCRVIIGFAYSGTYVQMFVLLSEMVGRKYRSLAGLLFWMSVPMSYCLQGLQAYLATEWKHLSIISTAPYIFVVCFYKFIPESFIWLRMQGKMDQVLANLKIIGEWNKKELPKDIIILPPSENLKHKSRPTDLFGNRKLALQSSIQCYSWTIVGMVYYGLSLEADNLGGSMYRDYILLSIVDIPAIILAMLFSEIFGRKKTVILPMLFGSMTCLSISFISAEGEVKVARVILGLLGKFLVSLSFYAMYTWSVELYPVHIRGEGMGFLQVASKLGGAGAPWIAKCLLSISDGAPYIVMGVAGIIASIMEIWLPETSAKNATEPCNNKETSKESTSS